MRKLPKILIVEDELRMCERLEYLLKTKDYNVKTDSCGRDALALIAENTFDLAVLDIGVNSCKEAVELIHRKRYGIDLVILDMIMPGMDGGKTFDYIREKCPQIPVLLSSGYAMNGQAEKIMNRGCDGFIQKPFSVYELSQKIRKILDKKTTSS